MARAVMIFVAIKRSQFSLSARFSAHLQAVRNVSDCEVLFSTAIDLDTIAGCEQEQFAPASFTQHRLAPRMPGESLARFNLRSVMAKADAEKFHA
jgi:hypothetical protein